MSEKTKQLKVFLCHSSGDKPVVRKLYEELISEGWIDPWLDAEKLIPGQDWQLEIPKAVQASNVVVVCCSNSSVSKEGYIQKELRFALDKALEMPDGMIFIIPIRLDDCDIPSSLSKWQWVDYFPSDRRKKAYERLITGLKMRADALEISTDIPSAHKDEPVSALAGASQSIGKPSDDNKQFAPDYASIKPETRYGLPTADQILYNKHFTIGYSYSFRQAKWALEIVDLNKSTLDRADNFRPDFRIPNEFRADLADYTGSGYDRGHLVASVDRDEVVIQKSETFLLSNMSPMKPAFFRGVWKELEKAVRELESQENIYETFAICGPIFDQRSKIRVMSSVEDGGITLPIPDGYFKSVLTENNRGALHMWSFMMDNEESGEPLENFLVPTTKVEQFAGIILWQQLAGRGIEREKSKVRKMWKYD